MNDDGRFAQDVGAVLARLFIEDVVDVLEPVLALGESVGPNDGLDGASDFLLLVGRELGGVGGQESLHHFVEGELFGREVILGVANAVDERLEGLLNCGGGRRRGESGSSQCGDAQTDDRGDMVAGVHDLVPRENAECRRGDS